MGRFWRVWRESVILGQFGSGVAASSPCFGSVWTGFGVFCVILGQFGSGAAASLPGFGSVWTGFDGFGAILGAGASQACSLNVLNHIGSGTPGRALTSAPGGVTALALGR